MNDKQFPFGSWIYNPLSDFTPDEVDTWKEFGLTVTMSPLLRYGKDDMKALIPFLEKAEKEGVKLIAFIGGLTLGDCARLGEEKYRERFTEVYNLYKDYSSLYGFFIGDEPSDSGALEATKNCVRIQKEIAPDLDPYINFMGSTYERTEAFEGTTFAEWMKNFVKETGIRKICFDTYSAAINDEGVSGQMADQRNMVEAITAAGAEPWVTLLCSGHLVFHVPSEFEQCMQINAAAACGCRGIIWFRMYDRDITADYHGSPVDEFGFKTEHYYRLQRCMRRFNLHYGELLLKLKRTKTFYMGKKDGGYPKFGEGCHDVLTSIKCYDDLIVSFFEDADGNEYLVIVNLSLDINYTALSYNLDKTKGRLREIALNGKQDGPIDDAEQYFLHPGQMAMYRIERGDFSK